MLVVDPDRSDSLQRQGLLIESRNGASLWKHTQSVSERVKFESEYANVIHWGKHKENGLNWNEEEAKQLVVSKFAYLACGTVKVLIKFFTLMGGGSIRQADVEVDT